ncbi:MAG TPA: hypothetical protein VGN20_03130 [Mucilaginibacter sp.]|jgi:hypothetical protein
MIKDAIDFQLSVYEPENACRFLMKYFGFFKSGIPGRRISERQGFLICNSFGNKYFLIPKTNPVSNFGSDDVIVVNTDDCLRDYHLLNATGIKFEKKPQYTRNGLEAIIIDEHRNIYKLLEKRDYSDM